MYKIQYRRVEFDQSLHSMGRTSMESRHSENWDSWDTGEFASIEDAIGTIESMYALVDLAGGIKPIIKKKHLGCIIYLFEEVNQYIQIRFVDCREEKARESPWKIGLNNV